MNESLSVVYAEDMVTMTWHRTPKDPEAREHVTLCPWSGNELECDYPKTLGKLRTALGEKLPACSRDRCPVLMHVEDPIVTG